MYKTQLRNGTTKVNYDCAKQINVEKYKRCFVEILPVIVCINFPKICYGISLMYTRMI